MSVADAAQAALAKMTVEDLDLAGRRVLVRVDFNVPLADGKVADDTRIRAALPTIERILERGGAAILMSHLGRPKGKRHPELSLAPVAYRLGELLGRDVVFVGECIGAEAQAAARALQPGGVVLLENLRFHAEETQNDAGFAAALAQLGDLYVNDAFGTAHRAHASTAAVAAHFEHPVAGYLMQRELEYLGSVLAHPQRPFVAILGGAKISGKIDVIQNLLNKVDRLLIGGGMAFTFLKSQGREVGRSLVEDDRLEMAHELLTGAEGSRISLPIDCVVASDIATGSGSAVLAVDELPADKMGLDIGPATVDEFARQLHGAKTIVWNGPMGVFEQEAFAAGTYAMAQAVARATDEGATSIIGGGDSARAVANTGTAGRMSHISTGGGASLEFLEGKALPGVTALKDR
jgi:phosphoglycerate kinase